MELLQGKRMPKEETISVELAQEVLDDSLRISDREIQRKHVISTSIILLCCVSLMLLISIILNIINLSVSPDSGTYTPDLSSEAYETTLTGENEEIFTNPEHALEQITEDVQSFDSEEWNYLIKILSNTYKEVTAE